MGTKTKKPWAQVDRPLDQRTAGSVLLAFKRMLVEWGYGKQQVKVDTDACTLQVDGKEILKAKVSDYTLQLQWSDGAWESWEDLQSSAEFDGLRKSAQEKLDRAKGFASTGTKGKGKKSDSH